MHNHHILGSFVTKYFRCQSSTLLDIIQSWKCRLGQFQCRRRGFQISCNYSLPVIMYDCRCWLALPLICSQVLNNFADFSPLGHDFDKTFYLAFIISSCSIMSACLLDTVYTIYNVQKVFIVFLTIHWEEKLPSFAEMHFRKVTGTSLDKGNIISDQT